MILLILVRKMFLVTGRMVFLCLNTKRWLSLGRLLILRWLVSAFLGSTMPSCSAQKMSLPFSLATFIHGMKMTVCLRLFRSRTSCLTSETLTCVSGLKLFRFGTVTSPSRAVPQKAVVRHASMAVSLGSSNFRLLQMIVRISLVYGFFSFFWDSLGESLLPALKRALSSLGISSHLIP